MRPFKGVCESVDADEPGLLKLARKAVALKPRLVDVSSVARPLTSITGSTATRSRTYATSSLSALVNPSCAKPVPTVVCSGEAPMFGGGVGVPALIATVAPRGQSPLEARRISQ